MTKHRNDLQENTALAILRAAQRLQYAMNGFFQEFGITSQQYNVLRVLALRGDPTMPVYSIRAYLLESVPDISRMISRMERDGLVQRHPCPSDKRVTHVQLTEKGRDLQSRVDARVLSQIHTLVPSSDQPSLQSIQRYLDGVAECPPGEECK